MRKYMLLAFVCLALPAAAQEPSPLGEWRVQEGTAQVRIVQCSGALWGVLSWLKTPDVDKNNPDPALRERTLLELPILRRMQPYGDRWKGEIYNSENGKIYSGSIALSAPGTLHIEGCVLGFLCGGEQWKRVSDTANAQRDKKLCAKLLTDYSQ